jgi:hypothetical protein
MKFNLLFTTFLLLAQCLIAQNFLDPADLFSKKKESYITLNDGTELVGFVDDIDRKKGLIEEITIEIKDTKKERKLKPEQIKYMYLVPSGFDKFARGYDTMLDATKWNDDHSVHAKHIKDGYVFFESIDVMIKKNKQQLLLQLLNPGFASKIRVYYDPFASETMSFSVGGITVAGGDDKSYYLKKGDNTAFRLYKKNYKEEWKNLYGDCPALENEFKNKQGWSSIEKHIFYYDTNCN